jgi:hypothetical protein
MLLVGLGAYGKSVRLRFEIRHRTGEVAGVSRLPGWRKTSHFSWLRFMATSGSNSSARRMSLNMAKLSSFYI